MNLAYRLTFVAGLLVATSYATAQTQQPQQQDGAQLRDAAQACKPDIQKFCANVQPGGGRVAACLREHAADLSPACKQAAAQRQSAAPAKK